MRNTGPVACDDHVLEEGVTPVSTTDLKSCISYCNPAFIQVNGYAPDELLGQPHNMIRHPDGPAEATGRTVRQSAQAVERVFDLIANMSRVAHEQAQAVEQVNKAVSQLDNVTQQNGALVEQLFSAAHSLLCQAEEVSAAVRIFRMPSGAFAQAHHE